MAELEITPRLDDRDVRHVDDLIERVRAARDLQPIDEHRWLEASRGAVEFGGLVLRDDGLAVAYAQATREGDTWALDLVVDPGRDDGNGRRLLGEAIELVRKEGGGEVSFWVHGATTADTELAGELGLRPARDLWQMRVRLPLAEQTDLPTRPFRPGRDDASWLEVNNAAFASHPEQGSWTMTDLQSRQEEPWFDADGFLLHEVDGRLAGFCWTKVHRPTSGGPALGEIYVIAVHPDFHGRGLGRALVIAGLEHLSRQVDTGMLYVEADNEAAVGLYRALGFEVHHVSRAFVGEV